MLFVNWYRKIIREYVGIKASLWSIGGLSVARRVRACGQKISKYQINWKKVRFMSRRPFISWPSYKMHIIYFSVFCVNFQIIESLFCFQPFNSIIRIGNDLDTRFCGWVKFETWYWTSLARASPFRIWHLLKEKGQRSHIASENGPGQKIDTFSSRLAKADLQNRNNDNNNVLCSKQSFGNDIPIRNTKINIFITIITVTIGNVITIIFLVIFSKKFTSSSSSSSSSSPSSSYVPLKHLQMTFPSETCPGLLPPVSKPGYNMFSKYFI